MGKGKNDIYKYLKLNDRILIVGDQYFPDNRISLDIIADACRNAPRPLKIYVYRRPAHKPPEPVTISLLDSDDDDDDEVVVQDVNTNNDGSNMQKNSNNNDNNKEKEEKQNKQNASSAGKNDKKNVNENSNIINAKNRKRKQRGKNNGTRKNRRSKMFPNGTIVNTRFGAGMVETRRLPVKPKKKKKRNARKKKSNDTQIDLTGGGGKNDSSKATKNSKKKQTRKEKKAEKDEEEWLPAKGKKKALSQLTDLIKSVDEEREDKSSTTTTTTTTKRRSSRVKKNNKKVENDSNNDGDVLDVTDDHKDDTNVFNNVDENDPNIVPGIHTNWSGNHVFWSKKLQRVKLPWGVVYIKCDELSDLGDVEHCRYVPPLASTTTNDDNNNKSNNSNMKKIKPIRISKGDMYRLNEREYLNDVLIDVAISKIKAGMSDDVRSRVHIFNTYFFRLLQSDREDDIISFLKKKIDRFKVDLLHKDLIFIPVCEQTHWSLVLLCNIGMNYEEQRQKVIEINRLMNERFKREEEERMKALIEKEQQDEQKSNEKPSTSIEKNEEKNHEEEIEKLDDDVATTTSSSSSKEELNDEDTTWACDNNCGFSGNYADVSKHEETCSYIAKDGDTDTNSTTTTTTTTALTKLCQGLAYSDVSIPCILLLDSLKAHRAQGLFTKLRKLFTRLHNEYGTVTISDNGEQTMESNIVLNGETLTGFSVSDIPRQINGWDCGIYVIHYIQHIINNIDCLDTSWDYVSKKGKGKLFKLDHGNNKILMNEQNDENNNSSSSSNSNSDSNNNNNTKENGGAKLFNQDDIDLYRKSLKLELNNYHGIIIKHDDEIKVKTSTTTTVNNTMMDTNMIIDVDNANHVVNLNHNEGNTNKEKEFLTKNNHTSDKTNGNGNKKKKRRKVNNADKNSNIVSNHTPIMVISNGGARLQKRDTSARRRSANRFDASVDSPVDSKHLQIV